MTRRRNPVDREPETLKFTPTPGGSTTDFPHPEISDMIRMKLLGKYGSKHLPADTRAGLAAAYDEGYRDGQHGYDNRNPHTGH